MFFVELNGFGLNWLTASSAVILAITTWQYRATIGQARKIWTKRSAESVSITAAVALFFITAASLYYGIATRSLVISYTGGLCIPAFFVMWGAWTFGSPAHRERVIFAAGVTSMLAYSVFPVAWVFTAFAIATTLPLCAQLRELYKTGKRGVVHGELLATYVTKNPAIAVFAFVAYEPVYMIFGPVWLGLSIWLLAKWINCEPSEKSVHSPRV